MSTASLNEPFMLMCRSEEAAAWLMVPVEDRDQGDQAARGLQQMLGDVGSLRCELITNNEEGFQRWAKGSSKRKKAREQFLQQRRSQS